MTNDESQSDGQLAEVAQAAIRGDLLVFAGAGLSSAAGLPGWGALVDELVATASKRGLARDEISEAIALRQRGRLIDALSAIEQTLGKAEFGAEVERLLQDEGVEVPAVLSVLADLAPCLRAVLTTNVDRLLERAFPNTWTSTARAIPDLAQRLRVIVKLHGTLLERDTWVFTRDQYDRAMFNAPVYRATFDAFLRARTILFVGFGMEDDDLEQALGPVRATAAHQAPRHFAMLPAAASPFRLRQLGQAGVSVIPYENSDGRHAGLVRLLARLKGFTFSPPSVTEASAPVRSVASVAHASASEILERRPYAWELRFVRRVLHDELDTFSDLLHDYDVGLAPVAKQRLESHEFLAWVARKFREMASISGNLNRIVNVGFVEALGPPGVPADPAKLRHASRRFAESLREAVQWAMGWSGTVVDEDHEKLAGLGAAAIRGMIAELRRFVRDLDVTVDGLPEEDDDIDRNLSFRLELRIENQVELDSEIQRLIAQQQRRTRRGGFGST